MALKDDFCDSDLINQDNTARHAARTLEAMFNGTFTVEVIELDAEDLNLRCWPLPSSRRTLYSAESPRIQHRRSHKHVEQHTTASATATLPKKPRPTDDLNVPLKKIPRPPNSFMIFANEFRKQIALEFPGEKNKDISKRLGYVWKNLHPSEKNKFDLQARNASAEHKLLYPDYVYSPKEARMRKQQRDHAKQLAKSLKERKSAGGQLVMKVPSTAPSADIDLAECSTVMQWNHNNNQLCGAGEHPDPLRLLPNEEYLYQKLGINCYEDAKWGLQILDQIQE